MWTTRSRIASATVGSAITTPAAERLRSTLSPIDEVALSHWEDYGRARDQMLARTHTAFAPWTIVRTDDKRTARINLIKDLLAGIDYKGKDERMLLPNPDVAFTYSEASLKILAP